MKQIYDYIDNKAKIEVYKENEEMSNLNENVKLYTFNKDDLCAINPYESRVYAAEVKETKMVVEDDGVKFAHITNLPFALISESVIPRIEDVQSINDKVVIVKFADGTTEKAILSDEDTFSLEQGISICITKKILNVVLKGAKGGSAYNKLVDYGLKVYNDKQKEIEKAKAAAKAEKEAEKKKAEKNRKKKAKRKAKLREEQIEIQAEAYRRAMQTD
jgi:predicted Fe-Mo cluster-binding NifX family protein